MAAAVVSHLVKVEPENEAWWINLAYPFRRTESVEKAEAILLRGQAIHPNVAIACYASVRAHGGGEKARCVSTEDRNVFALFITASSFLLPAPRPYGEN